MLSEEELSLFDPLADECAFTTTASWVPRALGWQRLVVYAGGDCQLGNVCAVVMHGERGCDIEPGHGFADCVDFHLRRLRRTAAQSATLTRNRRFRALVSVHC